MAFFLTLLYVVTAFVSPPVLFGPFHEYHVEMIIAALALLCSIPSMSGSQLLQKPQTIAIAALCVCVVMSVSLNTSLREGATAAYNFIPVTFTYFLTALNCKTKRHLQLIFGALLLGSLYFIVHGFLDLRNGVSPSLYLYGDEGLRRLRGLGLINDPNDFSQVMVSLVPCMFLLGRKSSAANLFVVGVPVAILVTGLYLAHSRGAAVALMGIIILSARRKIGTVPAMVVAGALFAGSLAFGWSGGRSVSMEAGADRLDAWVMGIEFMKAHPLLGIGNNRFGELNDITAHNSIVVCAAENGFLGFVCWVLFIFSSLRAGVQLSTATRDPQKQYERASEPLNPKDAWAKMLQKRAVSVASEPALAAAGSSGFPAPGDAPRMAQLLVFALTGFLTAGWFLSRALSPWMFMYGGMMVAVDRMAAEEGFSRPRESFGLLLRGAALAALGVLALVYVTLKVRAALGQ